MWRLHALAIVGVLAMAGPAAASHEAIPPDNSGVGQYTENVPGAGGDTPSGAFGGGGSGGSGSDEAGEGLPSGAEGALDSLASEGPVGAAAAGLARAGAEIPGAGKASKAGSGGTGDGGEGDGSYLGDLLGQLTGSDSEGMGVALPVILGASALTALLLGLARVRRRPQRSMHP